MEICNCTIQDLVPIFDLYDAAIAHQKAVSGQHWLPFERGLVLQEIEEKRQWKILIDGQIACVFVTAYQDPAIWGEKDAEPSVYLHRIVTHPDFRGRHMVATIVDWARKHALEDNRRYLRLDTWADNLKLKEIYLKAGFKFLGIQRPADPTALPSHYSTIVLSMFEIDLQPE